MYGASESPGSIRNQIGRSLNAIRENIEQEEPLAVANHLRDLISNTSPKTDEKDRKKWKEHLRDARDAADLFDRCMEVKEELLIVLARQGLYAWNEAPPGNAGKLALRGPDAESPPEVVTS